jgi:hypothetical protein
MCGGSENIIRYEANCPKCNHYIGLTQTPEEEAKKFLAEYGLEYLVDSPAFSSVVVKNDFCKCKGGAVGRTVTEDFEHQVCEQCGKVAK